VIEPLLHAVLDSMIAFVAVMNGRGAVLYANRISFEVSGLTPEEVLGRHIADTYWFSHDASVQEELRAAVVRAAAGERMRFDTRARLRGGGLLDLDVSVLPMGPRGPDAQIIASAIDITERKRAERELLEAKARAEALGAEMAAVLGQLAEGVIVADAAGRIAYVNDAAARLHGAAKLDIPYQEHSAAYGLFTEDGLPFPPEELPLTRASMHGETVLDARWRIRRPDGTEVLAIGSARPLLGPDGRQRGAVLTLRDDTARHAAEQAVRESEARVRALGDNLPGGVVYQLAMDRDGSNRRFVYMSRSHAALTGVPAEAALADPLVPYRLIAPEDRPRLAQAEETAIRTLGTFDVEVAFRRADTGERRWCRIISAPRPQPDGTLLWDGLQLDVTAQKLNEEALREGERQLRLLADALPLLVAYIGPDLRYRVANRAYREWLGLEPEQVVGRTVPEVVGEEIYGLLKDRIAAALAGRPCAFESWLVYPGGRRHVHIDYIPHVGQGGQVEGFFVAVADHTDRRLAEERQRLLMREVDHRAKNALAVVQALVRLTTADTMSSFVAAVEGRVAALARAHALLANNQWSGAELADIVRDELEPYAGTGRIGIDGPPVTVAADSVQALGMILHELAVNAAKHGALSLPGGRVAVSWQRSGDGTLEIVWRERGGPPLAGRPERRGFGSELIAETALVQLGGEAAFHWEPEGLCCRLSVAPETVAGADG